MPIRRDQDWDTQLTEGVSETVMQSDRDFAVKTEWADFWRERQGLRYK